MKNIQDLQLNQVANKMFEATNNMDEKYDQSFRKSELGKEEYDADDNSDEVAEAMHSAERHAVKEPDNFGGSSWL